MAEIWELYDKNRTLTGIMLERGKPVPNGYYHLVTEVITVNSTGKILTTKRHPSKKGGLKWEITGGAAIKGEESRTAAVRELFEETGIRATENELRYIGTISGSAYFIDVYIVHKDYTLEQLSLQESEVVDAKWVSVRELENMIKTGEAILNTNVLYSKYKDKIHDFIKEAAEGKV